MSKWRAMHSICGMAAVLFMMTPVYAQYIDEAAGPVIYKNRIDDFIFDRLKKEGVQPAPDCSDAVFVRRVYLDMTGALPTGDEAWNFIKDDDPAKREALIDQLFESGAFADYWAMKWCDILRVKAEFPCNLWPNAVQAYHRWLREAIEHNKPYDELSREMLTACGSNFRDAPVNFFRAVKKKDGRGIAEAVAQTFMGERAEKWDEDRLDGMAAFFSYVGYKRTAEWKEEIVYFDVVKASTNRSNTIKARYPNGKRVRVNLDSDPRVAFADWLTAPGNPYLSRAIVNRIWFWLMGRGLIHEPDDIRPDNPPTHPELLAWLESELVDNDFDLRHIYRLILNSAAYQRASVHPDGRDPDPALYAAYPLRRLEAEVLIDALNQLTGTHEEYSSNIPEPFTFIPAEMRAVQIADGSITSSFLDMFGRPPRATGLLLERDNSPSDTQALHLLNSSHIQRKIYINRLTQNLLKNVKWDKEKAADRVYLHILSRPPTREEKKTVVEYLGAGDGRQTSAALQDAAWALINSKEFLYRH